jgi:hypothetical protein
VSRKPPETGARLFSDHHARYEESSDEFYTPAALFVALDTRFDVDVASPPGGLPWIPADRFLDQSIDGLSVEWEGFVWCNPPYSNPGPWLERMSNHKNGIMLLPVDTSTVWWQRWATKADVWVFISGRVRFVKADGEGQPSWTGRFPSVLVGWGDRALPALRSCNLGWLVDRATVTVSEGLSL